MKSQKYLESNRLSIILFAFLVVCLLRCAVDNGVKMLTLAALCGAALLLHGASPFCQSYVALRYEYYGRSGTASGILNSAASVGNILASYIFAKMSEVMPWGAVAMCWLAVIIICDVLCIAVLPRWTRFTEK